MRSACGHPYSSAHTPGLSPRDSRRPWHAAALQESGPRGMPAFAANASHSCRYGTATTSYGHQPPKKPQAACSGLCDPFLSHRNIPRICASSRSLRFFSSSVQWCDGYLIYLVNELFFFSIPSPFAFWKFQVNSGFGSKPIISFSRLVSVIFLSDHPVEMYLADSSANRPMARDFPVTVWFAWHTLQHQPACQCARQRPRPM